MENKKMTYVQALSFVLDSDDISLPSDVREKLEALSVSLEKRNNGGSKKVSAEREAALERVLEVMEDAGTPVTASDIMRADLEFFRSNQQVTGYLYSLIEQGKVEKVTEKRKTFFKLV
mgnify:CR=1 FL=1